MMVLVHIVISFVVNFSVDVETVVSSDYDNVVINGSFSGWNGWGVTLTDDGDGVYEGSLTVDLGTYEYVHALTGSGDGWSGWGVLETLQLLVKYQEQEIMDLQLIVETH